MHMYLLVTICMAAFTSTMAQSGGAILCYTNCQKYANDLTNLGNKMQSQNRGEADIEQLTEACSGYNKIMGCLSDCPSGDKVIDVVRDMMPKEMNLVSAMCDGRGVGLGGGMALVPGVGVVVALMTSLAMVVIGRM